MRNQPKAPALLQIEGIHMTNLDAAIEREQPPQARTQRFDVIVIGGGQAGLAVGYYLSRAGLNFVILDEHDRVGDAWRNRWDSLRLFTPAGHSSLPGMSFPGPRHEYPGKDQVANYLEQYATVMNLPVRHGSRALRVTRAGEDRWRVETAAAAYFAQSVVIATGGYQRPNIPEWSSELDPDIRQLHSSDYRNPAQLSPGPVLIVGASHSGAEIAIEVAREHPTKLVGRDTGQQPFQTGGRLDRVLTPLIWFGANRLLTIDNPIGRKAKDQFLDHGLPLERPRRGNITAAGVERVTARANGARDGKLILEDGSEVEVRNVIWCTGFRGDYSWVEDLEYDDGGHPEQDHGVVIGMPGLYFVGLKFQRAVASSLIGGVGRDAAHVAHEIVARARRQPGPPPETFRFAIES